MGTKLNHIEEKHCLQSESLGRLSGPASHYLFGGGGFESRVAAACFSDSLSQLWVVNMVLWLFLLLGGLETLLSSPEVLLSSPGIS